MSVHYKKKKNGKKVELKAGEVLESYETLVPKWHSQVTRFMRFICYYMVMLLVNGVILH